MAAGGKAGPKSPSKPRAGPGPGPLAHGWLVLYNIVLTAGWIAVLYVYIVHVLNNPSPPEVYSGIYDSVEVVLKVFQSLALLEIVHAALGIVPSNVLLTAFQVFSRVFLLWGVAHPFKEAQTSLGMSLCIAAWTITEIIRYSFYTFALLKMKPYVLQWCRYTFFIVLYPIGVSGELLAIYSALTPAAEQKAFSLEMPNPLNFSFYYHYFLVGVMLTYIPVFPQLYFHMVRQRRKIIGGVIKVVKKE
ncbi:HACD2 [Branchiostoma lanceolatum]|uniref:Very-long-chain (3R)-3-hydroxyacyl-CoA dehydratase n=1 Tax=Branchiostoma lanceolatum TaxID=7740 RepID=A0A8J9Z548_BRALA|nr:HACD2 [Branchiostoma lanceolatum]